MNKLSSIVSEFGSTEEAAAYDRWLSAKVAASLSDSHAPSAHGAVMAEAQKIIDERKPR